MKSYIKLMAGAALAASALMLGGCQNDFDAPKEEVPMATMQANTTIAELKAAMWQDDTNYAIRCPYKDEATKTPYIIKGRVISSDASGNVYKSIYIQDDTAALTFSVNQSDMYAFLPFGQEVVVDLTGLYIGKYAGLQQVGWIGEYQGNYQVSFMGYEIFTEHLEKNGLPEPEAKVIGFNDPRPTDGSIYILKSDIGVLNGMVADNAKAREMMSQLVQFDNVHFEGAGELTFSNKDENINRNLVDENGNTIAVRTSGYSDFWNMKLPEGNGSVRGLLSYFNGTWQIVLRSLDDCIFASKGLKGDPYTVAEAIELEGSDTKAWVEGYVVGSLKAGVKTISGNEDVIWSEKADLDNSLVIGPTPDCTEISECLVMALPVNSDMRKMVNLFDNPERYKQVIKVYGKFEPYLGAHGIVGNKGTNTEFWIEGMQEPVTPEVAEGDGTADKPYNVSQIIDYATQTGTGSSPEVYFSGYVTSIKTIDTSYGSATFYIADKPGGATTFYVYRIYDIGGAKFASDKRLKVGDLVVIKSQVTCYMGNTPETVQNKGQLVSVNGSTEIPTDDPGDKPGDTPGDNPGENPGNNPDPTPSTPGVSEGKGDGTETNPYDVAFVMASTEDLKEVWVEGYIAGYVTNGNFTATSGAYTADNVGNSNNYLNESNILLSQYASPLCGFNNSVPAQLDGTSRPILGLKSHPEVFGKKVKVKCNIASYLGVRGLKKIKQVVFE